MLTESTYGFSRPRTVTLTTSPYLDGALSSVVCDLDATISASYDGSGLTWANLIASPADGTARAAYDFHLGNGSTDTTYPAFNGAAGHAAAYWSVDGGDYFRLKTLVGSIPEKWHRTSGGTPFWVAVTFKTPAGIFTGTRAFWGNVATTANRGVLGYVGSADTLGMVSSNGATAPVLSNISSALSGATDYAFILSADPSLGSDNVRVWVNSASGSLFSHNFGATTTNSTDNFYILATKHAGTEGGYIMEAGTRFYSFAMGNEYLDDTKAAAILAHLGARHGRSYA